MFLLNVDASKISLADLEALTANQVIESRDIEYKRTVTVGPAALEHKKIKLLAGISSFANTDGGDLLVGIRASQGVPVEVTPIERARVDEMKLAIEQLVQTGITPRIAPSIHEVRVSETHSVLLVRVWKSWSAPHRVTLGGPNGGFYGRHSSGMYPMDVDQLRGAFLQSGTIHDRLRNAQRELLRVILSREFLALPEGTPWLVVHLIPFDALDPAKSIDVSTVDHIASIMLAPVSHGDCVWRFNFDGLLTTITDRERAELVAYTQLFRNGTIESVDATMARRVAANAAAVGVSVGSVLPALGLAKELILAVQRFLRVQQHLGTSLPIALIVSFLGVKGYALGVDRSFGHSKEIDRNTLIFPGIVIDSYDNDPCKTVKPILDALWNASGWPRCMDYRETGEWAGDTTFYLRDIGRTIQFDTY